MAPAYASREVTTFVGKYMGRHRQPPSQTWRTFLKKLAGSTGLVPIDAPRARHVPEIVDPDKDRAKRGNWRGVWDDFRNWLIRAA
jgi:hypothetical protein